MFALRKNCLTTGVFLEVPDALSAEHWALQVVF